MSDSEDPIDPVDEGGDDLFGDEDDGSLPPASPKEQALDDDELASDPEEEENRRRRRNDDDDDDEERGPEHDVKQNIIIDMTAYRHPVPKPTDGSVSFLRESRSVTY